MELTKKIKIKTIRGDKITKNEDDDRIFPFSYIVFRKIWVKLLKRVKMNVQDKSTKFHTLRIHGLRKFFRKNFVRIQSGKAIDAVEQLMCHERYLQSEYAKIPPHELKDLYVLAEEPMMILSKPMLQSEAKERILKLEAKLAEYKEEQEALKKFWHKVPEYRDLIEKRIKDLDHMKKEL